MAYYLHNVAACYYIDIRAATTIITSQITHNYSDTYALIYSLDVQVVYFNRWKCIEINAYVQRKCLFFGESVWNMPVVGEYSSVFKQTVELILLEDTIKSTEILMT